MPYAACSQSHLLAQVGFYEALGFGVMANKSPSRKRGDRGSLGVPARDEMASQPVHHSPSPR